MVDARRQGAYVAMELVPSGHTFLRLGQAWLVRERVMLLPGHPDYQERRPFTTLPAMANAPLWYRAYCPECRWSSSGPSPMAFDAIADASRHNVYAHPVPTPSWEELL